MLRLREASFLVLILDMQQPQPVVRQRQQMPGDAMDVDYEEAMTPYEQEMQDLLYADIATRAGEMVPETPEHSQT